MTCCDHETPSDAGRRTFLLGTAAAAAIGAAESAGISATPAEAMTDPGKRKFI
jgi:hypothetical protein